MKIHGKIHENRLLNATNSSETLRKGTFGRIREPRAVSEPVVLEEEVLVEPAPHEMLEELSDRPWNVCFSAQTHAKHMRNTCEKRPKATNPSGFAWFCLHIQAPHLFSSSMLKRLAGSTALRCAEGHQGACRRRSLKSRESRFRLLGRSTTRSSSSSFDSMSSQVPFEGGSRYEREASKGCFRGSAVRLQQLPFFQELRRAPDASPIGSKSLRNRQ